MIDEFFESLGLNNLEEKRLSLDMAMLAFAIFITGAVISYFLHPGYSIMNDFISTLGTGQYGWVMNISFISTGILLLPIFLALYSILDDYTHDESRKFLTLGAVSGIISQIGLILVGIFVDHPGRDIHSFVAGVFFFALMFCIVFLTRMTHYLHPNTVFDRLDRKVIKFFGYGLAFLDFLMIFFNLILYSYNYDAFIQKIVVLASFFYLGYFISQIRSSYIQSQI